MKRIRLLQLAALILVAVTNLSAQVRNRVPIGARPLAMGETFAGIADDANAIYWNPAGLPLIENYGFYFMHANLYNVSGLQSNYLSFFLPFAENLAFGVDWFNIGFGDDEIEVSDQKINLALGYKISDKLSLGLNLKHLRFEGTYRDLQRKPFDTALASGFGADASLLYQFSNKLRLGLMAHDVTGTKVKYDSSRSDLVQPRNFRYGAAYWLRKNLLLAADIDDRIHLGGELKPASFIALRAGLQKDRHTDEGLTYAFGAGLDMKLLRQTLRLDYAYTVPPALPDMSTFSVSLLFDLFSPKIKIETVNISPIYPPLYKRHSKDSIGTAVIRYKGKERLNYEISVSIPRYAQANPQKFFIEPRSVANDNDGGLRKAAVETVETVPLYAIFTDSILAVEGNTPMLAGVEASYSVNRKTHTAHASREFQLFSRNRLNWARGVEQVAAFIDHEDSDVEAAANDFLKRVEAEVLINSNLSRAQKLFEGLGLVDIAYKEDPYEAYTRVYNSLDNVLYPYQLLKEKKTGDCDDLTVLYAALLENCSIPVALLSAPGHIFLMLDSGIHERMQDKLKLPPAMYHIYDGSVWIPIEIIEVGKSFDVAWEQGAKNFQHYAAAGDTEIVKVRTAWQKYEAVKYPRHLKDRRPLRYVNNGKVKFVRQIRQQQEKYVNELKQQLAEKPIETRNRLAKMAAFDSNYVEAEKYLREVIALDSKNFIAHNNLGNVYFLQAKLDSAKLALAKAHYSKAQTLTKTADDSLGIRLNLGVYYYVVHDDTLMATETIAEAFNGRNDTARVERLLGLKFDQIDLRKAGPEQLQSLSAVGMKNLVLQARDARQKKAGQKPPRKTTKPAGNKGRTPSKDEINVLFWAQ
jgi:hypothetical protein